MRKFLLAALLLTLTLVIAACGGQTPTETEQETEPEVVEVEREVTVVVTTEGGETETVTETVVVTATPDPEQEAEMEEEMAAADMVTMHINHGAEPPSLDPSIATDTTSVDVITNMFVGLTRFNQEAEVEPWAATDWEVSEDGRTYTFTLRDDLSWVYRDPASGEISEVRPLTAADFEFGIKRTLNPDTASDYAYVLYAIEGAEAYNTGDSSAEDFATIEEGVGVNAIDDTTLEVTFAEPIGYGPAILGMWITYAQPSETIAEWGEGWTEAGRIVTSGAYTLEDWNHNANLNLIKNPNYFEADNVQIERIVGAIISEESTAMSLFEAGDLDITGAPLADIDRIRADAELSEQLFISPTTCTYYYGFVNNKPPTDNVTVRQALSAAIDRTSLIENVLKGGQIPAHSFAPPGIFGNVADNMDVGSWMVMDDFGAQVEQAQAWMEEAGYPGGEGLDLLIMHNTSEAHAAIAQAIQAMWLDAFPSGNITIENQEWGVYLETIAPGSPTEEKPNVYRLGWCADYPDQNNWVNDVFNSQSGNNSAVYSNPEYDELVEAAAVEQDPAAREEMYIEAERMLVEEDAAIAPIYYYTTVQMRKPYMETVIISASGGNPWYQWTLDWDAKREAMGQ